MKSYYRNIKYATNKCFYLNIIPHFSNIFTIIITAVTNYIYFEGFMKQYSLLMTKCCFMDLVFHVFCHSYTVMNGFKSSITQKWWTAPYVCICKHILWIRGCSLWSFNKTCHACEMQIPWALSANWLPVLLLLLYSTRSTEQIAFSHKADIFNS